MHSNRDNSDNHPKDQSEERLLSDLLALSSDCVWETDATHRLTAMSEGFFSRSNRRATDVIGYSFFDLRCMMPVPYDMEKWQQFMDLQDAHSPFKGFSFTYIENDGRLIHWLACGIPLFDTDGAFRGYKGTLQDVTVETENRTTIEQQLRRYSTLFGQTSQFISLHDANGRYVEANQALLNMAGLSEGDIRKLYPWDLPIWPDDTTQPQKIREAFSRAQNGETVRFLLKHKDANGDEIQVDFGMKPCFNANGRVEMVMLEGQDITYLQSVLDKLSNANEHLERSVEERTEHLNAEIAERKIIESTLRESEQRLRDVIDTTADWFWEMDQEMRFTHFSERFDERSGRDHKKLLGKKRWEIAEINNDADRAFWDDHKQQLESHLPFRNIEYSYIEASTGRLRHVQASGTPVFDDKGTFIGYRGAARDITDMKKQESRVIKAREEAESANKAKSEFLSSMSHELRTPLNSVLGFCQLIMSSNDDPRTIEYANHISKAGQHLLDLINEILDLSKIEAGKINLSIEDVSFKECLDQAIDLMQPLAESHGIDIHLPKAEDYEDLVLRADETRVKQIFVNLMSNAIKYNTRGGKVSIRIEEANSRQISVSISDTGSGIAEDKLDMLFSPFQRLDAESSGIEGTGIGLALTHKLVTLQDGKISVTSDPGIGSTFTITLPAGSLEKVASCTPAPISLSDAAVSDGKEGIKKVLYVEDNAANVILMSEVFEFLEDVELIVATAGREGIAKALASTPDLVMLDIDLPDITGFDVARELDGYVSTRDIPRMAVSANAMPEIVSKGKDYGFADYLTKPLDIIKTVNTVRTLLDQ